MPRRPPPPIDSTPLVGGAACVDFVNTTGARHAHRPRERLRAYADLLTFARRITLLTPARLARLARGAAARPQAARRALARAVALRELLYRVLSTAARRGPLAPPDLQRFNTACARAHAGRELTWSAGRPRWRWRDSAAPLDALLAPLVRSAAELLASDRLAALRRCGECDWLFLDSTRNHTRRWCKAQCADRVRARRYYRRRRTAAMPTTPRRPGRAASKKEADP
ncbi:MAG: ABATE domain-containing protein [Phycisphaerae bacterium]